VSSPVSASLIGSRTRRLEDRALLCGGGVYAADPRLGGLVHLRFYRSPHASARVRELDLKAARQAPGVLAVWAAADLPELAAGMGDSAGRHLHAHPRPVLAGGAVRYQGEPIAVVVAQTPYQADDAVELVEASFDSLPPVVTVEDALAEGAPGVHDDLGGNVAGTLTGGFGDAAAAFGGAVVTASATVRAPRVCGGYMEPRATTAAFDAGDLTIWASTQSIFGIRDRAAALLELAPERVRVLALDVGGGFGPKGDLYPEDVVVAAAALRLGRPVRWVATRTEDTMSTAHAHGTVIEAELAAGRDGALRGLRARILHDTGAYTCSGAGLIDIIAAHLLSAYRLPALSFEARVVHTNTVPTGFVRGGGRPVGNFAMERAMDQLADRLGLDPVELRRRNLIQPADMPHDTGLPAGRSTVVYDSGDYPRLLGAVEASLAGVREGPRADGRTVGRGIVCCVESSGFGGKEPGRARLDRDGRARLSVGSTPGGQGHRTMAAQVFAERLGWPLDRVEVTAGDTTGLDRALLTAGSRSAVQVGNAAALVGRALRRRLLESASQTLEADPADLVMIDGRISVAGAPGRAVDAVDLVPEEGLEVFERFSPDAPLAYSSSCHGAVVALDPETGTVDVERYVMAYDTGRAVNPMLVEGQMHGGFAHGLGYALFEEAVYTPDGALASASFMDYTIPGPPEVGVEPELHSLPVPTPTNPEGIKGAGESGAVPVPAAIASSVERAVRHHRPEAYLGELPLSSERVLRAVMESPEPAGRC
jgi:carbon-monoxide dehydrogenase large subunit